MKYGSLLFLILATLPLLYTHRHYKQMCNIIRRGHGRNKVVDITIHQSTNEPHIHFFDGCKGAVACAYIEYILTDSDDGASYEKIDSGIIVYGNSTVLFDKHIDFYSSDDSYVIYLDDENLSNYNMDVGKHIRNSSLYQVAYWPIYANTKLYGIMDNYKHQLVYIGININSDETIQQYILGDAILYLSMYIYYVELVIIFIVKDNLG